MIDEQVLEFLLVSLLAFSEARPERLAELEGALGLLERLERQFWRRRGWTSCVPTPAAWPATCSRQPRPAGAVHASAPPPGATWGARRPRPA